MKRHLPFIALLGCFLAVQASTATATPSIQNSFLMTHQSNVQEDELEVLFRELDRNQDGKIQKSEVPEEHHGDFDEADTNDDGIVTRQELRKAIEEASDQDDETRGQANDREVEPPACDIDSFVDTVDRYDFQGNFEQSFPKTDRWPSHHASIAQSDSAGQLSAEGTEISEAWHAWHAQQPINRSWVVQAEITVPRAWDQAESRRGQVGIGLFVGKPGSPVARTVYEVNLACISKRMRFVQAQMIGNRLGGDPDDVQMIRVTDETIKLQILFSADEQALCVFANSQQVSKHVINSSGVVDWELAKGDKLDVGIMGFAEHTRIRDDFPSIRSFQILQQRSQNPDRR